jgi:peptidyl-prolyl cis-trans isomerase B (cyclophilin B)
LISYNEYHEVNVGEAKYREAQRSKYHEVNTKNMKKILIISFLICVLGINAQTKHPTIVIETNFGTMRAILYDDTPLHSEHYLKLIRDGYFDGTLFFRVIREFMIQGGSQDSRNAPAGMQIGAGSRSMDIPAEVRPHHFHKKGALAAPRRVEDNPNGVSDGSQFFIVHGREYTQGRLDTLEMAVNVPIRNEIIREHYNPYREELARLRESGDARAFNSKLDSLLSIVDSLFAVAPGKFFFPEGFREAYTPRGGASHLDGEYTVFGEVISGFDVINRIANLQTDNNQRPREDVRIIRMFTE